MESDSLYFSHLISLKSCFISLSYLKKLILYIVIFDFSVSSPSLSIFSLSVSKNNNIGAKRMIRKINDSQFLGCLKYLKTGEIGGRVYPLILGAAFGVSHNAYAEDSYNIDYFGNLDIGVHSHQLSGQDSKFEVDGGMLSTSYAGVRANAPLSESLTLNAEIASFFRLDDGDITRGLDGEGTFSRAAWAGIKGGFGSIRLGRISTLNFINTIRFNPFGASPKFSPSFMHNYVGSPAQPMSTGMGGSDSGWDNTINYTAPKLAGAVLSLSYAPDEGSNRGERMGGSITVGGYPFAAVLSVEKITDASITYPMALTTLATAFPVFTAQQYSTRQLGTSYDFKTFKLFGQLSRSKVEGMRAGGAQNYEIKMAQFGISVPAGPGVAKASFANSTMDRSWGANLKRDTLTVGYDYTLSDNAIWYTRYMHDKVSDLSVGNSYAMGVNYSF
ncbi:porin [Amphritea pacifica]|uniref:porin n=1 Tax=Amphritea pacifica TaxID=2811233 RepID=UPI0019666A60|nr:porin [Amphritea pacifica]